MKILIILILVLMHSPSFSQNQEVFIIGTMHEVPAIARNSYKPLLKLAKAYQPDAIYVERVRPEDTKSLENYTPEFLEFSDSLATEFTIDDQKFETLMQLELSELTKEDFKYLMNSFAVKRDYANYHYYRYLMRYGLKGSRRPLRNENDDLTAKLAIAMGMRYIYSMDDQINSEDYEEAQDSCRKMCRENGDNKIGNRLIGKDNVNTFFKNIFGGLGKYNNKPKSIALFHKVNSYRYVTHESEECNEATKFWDTRNSRMAKHIAEQVREYGHQKAVVIVGAGHVVGLKEELEKNHKDIRVKLIFN